LKKFMKRYKFFVVLLLVNIVVGLIFPRIGQKSTRLTLNNLKEMLSVIPPIFVLLGLLDVWVEKETMMRYMGEKSGVLGILIAFMLGSAAAGPLYAAFPIAGILLKKGSKFSNVLIFIGAWSTTKIPMLLFEATALGWRFMLLRFIINLPIIGLIAYITEKMLNKGDRELIYSKAV
jgi:uncharacterized membrane protein YraQ (UPF0718 family)